LRNFADETGYLYIFDKEAAWEGIRQKSPRMVFRESDLYTTVDADGVRDSSQEQRYQQMETAIRGVLDKIISAVRKGQLPGLSPTEKRSWDEFTYEQWRRVPQLRNELYNASDWQEQIRDAVERMQQQIGRELRQDELEQVAEFSAERRFRHRVLIGALSTQGSRALATLAQRGLYFGRALPRRSFLIGSRPTVRFRSPISNHLSDHGVEFWLPIAHDIIVSPGAAAGTESLFNLDLAMTRKVNRAVWSQSLKIAGKSDQLLASLLAQR
jgi:hypothetical protein